MLFIPLTDISCGPTLINAEAIAFIQTSSIPLSQLGYYNYNQEFCTDICTLSGKVITVIDSLDSIMHAIESTDAPSEWH